MTMRPGPYDRNRFVLTVVLIWITLALLADRGASLGQQYALGAITWMLLACLLAGESRELRSQVLVATAFATVGEYLAAPLLGFYVYRLENVPSFVPPGHGLVYLAAIALARDASARAGGTLLCRAALALGALWALWGITLASRSDTFGLLLFGVFALFLLRGRAPAVYASAFFVTAFLEFFGTAVGAWTWALTDPTGILGIGNPPSGIAAAYCLVDGVALRATRRVTRVITMGGAFVLAGPTAARQSWRSSGTVERN
jgi:hypothetical protein